MNFNVYTLIVPLYTLVAFFSQKSKINKWSSLFIISLVILITRLNYNYKDILQSLLLFTIFFIAIYWQYRKVNISVQLSVIPILSIYASNQLLLNVQFPTVWIRIIVTIGLISLLVYLSNTVIHRLYKIYPKMRLYFFIVLLFAFFYMYYKQLMALFAYHMVFNESIMLQGVYILVVSLFIMILYFFNNNSEQIRFIEQEKAQEEISQQYNQLITRQYDEVRRFRHDYQNILISLEGFIKAEEWDQLRDYFASALERHQDQTSDTERQLGKLIYLQNADLRHLLHTKLLYAISRGITVNIEVSESMLIETDEPHSLPRMLGIILDNAIEEAQQIQNGELSLSFIREELETLIIVENSCRMDIKDLSKLRTKGFSTKGENRGIGLYSLDRLLDKSTILLNTQVNTQVFTQELIIPKEVV